MHNGITSTGISAKLTDLQNGDNLQWSETDLTFVNAPAGSGVIISTASPATGDGTISDPVTLLPSGVTAASYTMPNITVNQYGLITTASNGASVVQALTNGTGITITGTSTNPIISVSNTAVTPAAYTAPNITIDSTGRITSATSNTNFVTNVLGSGAIFSSGGTTPTITLLNTAVTPGSYTNSNITVDAGGRITAASNGTTGVTTINAGTGISVSGSAPTYTISLPASGVTANTYTHASVTVNSNGIVTAAANGTAPVTSVIAGSGIVVTGTTTPTISLDVSGVTAGSYTAANITVDNFGRVTAAANGSGGTVTSVIAGSGISVTGTTTPTVSLASVLTGATADTRAITYNGFGQITSTATIQPKYDVIWSANQNMANNATTQITAASLNTNFRNKTSPSGNTFSTGTGTFTANKAGTYSFAVTATYAASAAGWRSVEVKLNSITNATIASNTNATVSASFASSVSASGQAYMNVGDDVAFGSFQNSGGTLSGTFYCSIVYVHD